MTQAGKETKELRTPELLLFAGADVFGGGGQSILSVLYLVFLTNILGIHPAWAGAVIMIAKGWDAVSDPLMGVISDNTRSRFGRRKPYLVLGGILLVFSMALLWLPVRFGSHAARVAYMTFSYLVYSTVSTVISVPYSSMSTEITNDFSLRNRVNVVRLVFSLVATAVCTLLPSMLFGSLTGGRLSVTGFYLSIVLGFGLAFAIPTVLAGVFVKERVPYGKERSAFSWRTLWVPLKVRAFRKLLGLYLAQSITLDIVSAVIIYYGLYVVPGISSTVFLGTFLGMQLLIFPVLLRLVDRTPKPTLYRLGLPLSMLGAAGIALFPAGGPPVLLYVITGLTALGFAGAQSMSWIMFPDVVDIGELSLGQRITGSFSGAMTFVRKVSSAVAIFLVGALLGMAGFVRPTDLVPEPAQPGATLLAIRLLILLAFVLLMGAAWLSARRFGISPALSRRVKELLEHRQAGTAAPKDAEDEARILKDLG
ncbi:MAG TPA: MFS transporter [Candidatus Limnocylindria bacterium]|nr:MFS transporter [Candidatus Limnocylindria bacterium]